MKDRLPFEEKVNFCLRENRIPYTRAKEEIWGEIEPHVHRNASAKSRPKHLLLKAAATLVFAVLSLSIAYYILGNSNVKGAHDKITIVSLPDGSVAKLNGDAVLEYNSSTWQINRHVSLHTGEAFFEVKKGSKFTVNTSLGDVQVLGTSFNVSVAKNELNVACKTGSVEVRPPGNRASLILIPGEILTATKNATRISQIPIHKIGSWVRGEFFFENVDVADVFEVVAEQTNYTIELNPGIDAKYTGKFKKSQPLHEILDIVCLPLNLEYAINQPKKYIRISKK